MVNPRDNNKLPKTIRSIQKPDDEDWPSGFPSLADGKNNQNLDLFDDMIDPQKDNDFLCDDDLVESEANNLEKSQDKKLETSSLKSEPRKDILLESNRNNIVTDRLSVDNEDLAMEDDKRSTLNEDHLKPFSEEEQLKNVLEPTEEMKESEIPEVPEPSPIKPAPSLNDIMNDDLTGAFVPPPSKKKARTLDDLPGGAVKISKDEKAEALTEELMFYLVMECRNSLFPQRVNPTKLKLRTEEEIKVYEKRKADEASQAESEPKSPEELNQEMDDEYPQSKMAIKTDNDTVKEYMHVLFDKINGREDDFIANLSSPLQRNPLEILMHLQNTQYELDSFEQLPYQQSVLPVDIYLDIERGRKRSEEDRLNSERLKAREEHENQKQKKKEDKKKLDNMIDSDKPKNEENAPPDPENEDKERDTDSMSSFTKDEELDTKLFNLKCEWENIHNKAIFDAVNEALDGLRPYGLKGPPLPWSKQSRTLTYKNGDPTELPQILKGVDKRIQIWIGDQKEKEPYRNVWEERLAVILANEIEENEPLWTDYEFEETHVKLDLAEIILDELYDETAQILQSRKEKLESQLKVTNN